jgi:hypothetical protein
MSTITLDQARTAKIKAAKVFGRKANVVGVGITQIGGSYGVKVNIREAPKAGTAFPESVEGVPVQVEVVGRITKR